LSDPSLCRWGLGRRLRSPTLVHRLSTHVVNSHSERCLRAPLCSCSMMAHPLPGERAHRPAGSQTVPPPPLHTQSSLVNVFRRWRRKWISFLELRLGAEFWFSDLGAGPSDPYGRLRWARPRGLGQVIFRCWVKPFLAVGPT
jgi:hypothetical protein